MLEKYQSIKSLFESKPVNEEVLVGGWVKSSRGSKKFAFLVVNDGSCFKDLQVVLDAELKDFDRLRKLGIGTSVSIKGKVVASQGEGQAIELQAQDVQVIGETQEGYPLQKKATSMEFLRDISHVRPRTNLFGAVFRIRSVLAKATHDFFEQNG